MTMKILLPLCLLALAACSRPPVKEIAAAHAAINAAVKAGAEDYAIDQLRSARDTLTAANTQVESKDYRGAEVSAVDARARAEEALAYVEQGRAEAKKEAAAKIADAKALQARIDAVLDRGGKKRFPALADEAEDLRAHLASTEAAFDEGRYRVAIQEAMASESLLTDLKIRVEKAESERDISPPPKPGPRRAAGR